VITCLEDQLRRDESDRQFPYDDADGSVLTRGRALRGNLSVGIGRNLSAKGLSASERALLLANDIADATRDLETTFPWTSQLDEVRKGVLQNMTFNIGIAALAEFRQFLAKVQASDYPGSSQAMLNSLWAKQVGPRAQRLSLQMESGQWQ
jgi:lysozyme